MSNVQVALDKLASYRAKNTRQSQETFEHGLIVLNSGKASNLGDEEWSFYEQLALSALDLGRIDIADQCLAKLVSKFPDSPRVDVLKGIRMESTETPEKVLAYYDHLMKADLSNVSAWKRRVSVLRRLGRLDKAVEELTAYLDTVYTDLEGWLELADLYSTCNQYPSALQALSHALLLSPQNPFTFLQFAETAYTSGDLPLALKMYLVVIEMNDAEDADTIPLGISVRAWWGAKLCTRQLMLSSSYHGSPSSTPVPKNLALLDELATERVLTAYSGEKGVQTRSLVSGWMSGR